MWHLSALTPSLPLPCALLVVVSSGNCLLSRMVFRLGGSAVLVAAFVHSLKGGPSAVLRLFSYLTVPRVTPAGPTNSLPFLFEALPDAD